MMGTKHSKKNKIEIVNVLSDKYKEKSHLDVGGLIILRKDNLMDIPEIEIRLEGYFSSVVRFWSSDRSSPQISPIVSSIDSGLHTVN